MKRYTLEELRPMFEEIVVDYLANDKNIYFQDKVEKSGKNVPELIFQEREQLKDDIVFRINDYRTRKSQTEDHEEQEVYQKAINILERELSRVDHVSSEKQKQLFAREKEVYISHTFIAVPLNKKINALYDDFNLSVCFYDDLANETGVAEFNKLKTKEERMNYVRSHIEITHITMTLSTSTHASIAVLGNFKPSFTDVDSSSCEILPSNYADFSNVTLADCERIVNNDLKQIIQERIDMDKEGLKVLAERNVRGDIYKIMKSKNNADLYIRYVCPSTQRVYYNLLDTNYLAESKYFKEKDYDSYILAWYSINNLFMELDEEALAMATPRC